MPLTENSTPTTYQSVADFYAGKSIFITGGTGFVGQVIIEKLLYSCPDVGNIYTMIRDKRNISYQDRANNYFDSPIFNRLQKKNPESLKKIKFIYGDLLQPNCGIRSEDLKLLQQEVSIVFHCAATIKFDEPLPVAMKFNVGGTEAVMNICQTMEKVEIFVYMSTLYSNTSYDRLRIDETTYPSPMPLDQVYQMIKDNDENKEYTSDMLNGRPNTYVFTKALAENVVVTRRGNMPIIIIRPGIVTAANAEPVTGWLSSWMGHTTLLYATGLGICRTIYGLGDTLCYYMPVNYVANLTIVSAAKHDRSEEVGVYHSCASTLAPLTLQESFTNFTNECRNQKLNILPFPGVVVTKSEWIIKLRRIIFQIFPAYIGDSLLFITGKPVRFIKTQQKLAKLIGVTKYFFSQYFVFKMERGLALFKSLSATDQKIFPCDAVDMNLDEYWFTYVHGVKQFLLKGKQFIN